MVLQFLISALDGREWSASSTHRFTPMEAAPSTHCKGGWMVPKANLDITEKRKISCPSRETKPLFLRRPIRDLFARPAELSRLPECRL
jgi:hypothetical protein